MSVLPSLSRFHRPSKPGRTRNSGLRPLSFESLERRSVFSADLAVDSAALSEADPPPADSLAAYVALPKSAGPQPLESTVNAPPVTPVDLGEGEGDQENQAPVIDPFWLEIEGGLLFIRGTVIDDQDPTGLVVQLEGDYGTSTAIVMDDDTFIAPFAYDDNVFGSISAYVVDAQGARSETVTQSL